MEALILAMIIAYAVKKAAESAHDHWQGSKAANRKASAGKPVSQRARSAARHDTAYWAEQVRGGFPQVRHGLYMGWNAGRVAQLEGWQARAKAKADHAHLRARAAEAVREQQRRQEEALSRIRDTARQEAGRAGGITWPEAGGIDPDLEMEIALDEAREQERQVTEETGVTAQQQHETQKGTAMSGDTTYRQQMAELEAIRSSAEQEVNSTRRKMMTSRLDILQNLGLDPASLGEAAEIDDALKAQEKAARQTLDAADAAIAGLSKRHGGIQEAVDSAPVDKPAAAEFYTD